MNPTPPTETPIIKGRFDELEVIGVVLFVFEDEELAVPELLPDELDEEDDVVLALDEDELEVLVDDDEELELTLGEAVY